MFCKMPFWKKRDSAGDASAKEDNNKEKVNYKARLEHKQYLAQESPEPVYDISSCGLKSVPQGVYSKCKVLRKEALLLQDNELTCAGVTGAGRLADMADVLQVLDLRGNSLDKLPEEIGMLASLKVLYVSRNRLKKVPDSIGKLKNLQSLDLASNSLKELPWSALGALKKLKTLDLSANPKLIKLGKELSGARRLETLTVDASCVKHPPEDVCQEGTEAIMRELCKECDIEYVSPLEFRDDDEAESENGSRGVKNGNGNGNGSADDAYDRIVRGSLRKIEEQKENKVREMLAMQRALEEEQQKEMALAQNVMSQKKQLLNHLAQQEAQREEDVKKMQQLKDKEREDLFKSLSSAESSTDALIEELMKNNFGNSDPQRVLEELEKERKEMEELFTVKAGEEEILRQEEIKREMQRVIAEELRREQMRSQYEADRKVIIDDALSSDLKNSQAVSNVLAAKGRQQDELIGNLLEDERYQREAFSSLLIRQDQRHKQISNQVEQIQNELASLTMVEMTKKDLRVEFEKEAMAEKRETLTKLLMELMKQKEERATELQSRLQEMEENRSKETDNYWLIQYQKLLDSKPKGMVEAESKLSPDLVKALNDAGAEDYAPVLALKGIHTMKQLAYTTDRELSEMGVHNTYLRQKLLSLANAQMDTGAAAAVPSAPPAAASAEEDEAAARKKLADGAEEDAAPSAPPSEGPSAPVQPVETFQSTECVVCMENKCDIIFLPCGHVCVCNKCDLAGGKNTSECPLCRAQVVQKVRLR